MFSLIYKYKENSLILKIEQDYSYDKYEPCYEFGIAFAMNITIDEYRKIMVDQFNGFPYNCYNKEMEIRFHTYEDAVKAIEWIESYMIIQKLNNNYLLDSRFEYQYMGSIDQLEDLRLQPLYNGNVVYCTETGCDYIYSLEENRWMQISSVKER